MNKQKLNRIKTKMLLKGIGKKGMMDDLFDFFFTLAASVFLLLFIGAALRGGIESSNQQSLNEVADFKQIDSAINNLRVLLNEGTNLETIDIDEMVRNSQVLGGYTITTCYDYIKDIDCTPDPIGVGPCIWVNDKCLISLVMV
ncbi:hypothetical protein KKA95_02235 [Patescibacteria group bacterium]|nr:hypothetical protein [Patescibacteria group bacterium]